VRNDGKQVGLAKTVNTQCKNGDFGRKITKCTVIYGVYMVCI